MTTFTAISLLQDTLGANYTSTIYLAGFDKVNDALNRSLQSYNEQVAEIINSMATTVVARSFVVDGISSARMEKVDELGSGRTKRETALYEVAVPLDKFSFSTGWSNDFANRATVNELDRNFKTAQVAHQASILKAWKESLYKSANVTFKDKWIDNQTLTIRKAFNNDGTTPYPNLSGGTFASTHQHYVGMSGSAVTAAEIDSAITLVTEHDHATVTLIVHKNDVADLKSLSKFVALTSPLLVPASTSDQTVMKMDLGKLDNKVVGVWDGSFYVETRPWAVENYILCMAEDVQGIGYRELPNPDMKGLLFGEKTDNKLTVQEATSYFGFACIDRGSFSVIDITTGSSTYTSPTIA